MLQKNSIPRNKDTIPFCFIHVFTDNKNMNKTPAMAYYSRKIRTTDRLTLSEEIENAPLKKIERYFLWDVVEGLTYKELAQKYCKSEARVYQIKRQLFERMTQYDKRRLR